MNTAAGVKGTVRKIYRGVEFEVWSDQETWFWFVVDPCRDSGAIGAAATEAEALIDACESIGQMSARGASSAAVCERSLFKNESFVFDNWVCILANLERYLGRLGNAAA